MIRDDAEKLSTLLTERCAHQAPGVLAEVEALSSRIEFNAPGGGRPTLVRYKIRFRDEARVGHLDLDEARALLDDLDAGWGPDRIFEEIAARGGAVEPAETAEK
jgi:predicted ArsR family transcriptional regulator